MVNNKLKKIHLSTDQIQLKINILSNKLKNLIGSLNKKKRQNITDKLSKLSKALKDPNNLTINPIEKEIKISKDKARRAAKKIIKKKEVLEEKRKIRSKNRRINCLYCKKCFFIRWTLN